MDCSKDIFLEFGGYGRHVSPVLQNTSNCHYLPESYIQYGWGETCLDFTANTNAGDRHIDINLQADIYMYLQTTSIHLVLSKYGFLCINQCCRKTYHVLAYIYISSCGSLYISHDFTANTERLIAIWQIL